MNTEIDFYKPKVKLLFKCPKINWTLENLRNLPRENGVYALFNNDGTFLYVGESKNIYDRVYKHHRTGQASALRAKMQEYFGFKNTQELDDYLSCCYLQLITFDYGRSELEEYIINKFHPIFNNFKVRLRKGLI